MTGPAPVSLVRRPRVSLARTHPKRCAVYQFPHPTGPWAYIGVAYNPRKRFAEHRRTSWWYPQVNVDHVVITWYSSWAEAHQWEVWAIQSYGTLFNDQHNRANQWRVLPPAQPVPAARSRVAVTPVPGGQQFALLPGLMAQHGIHPPGRRRRPTRN